MEDIVEEAKRFAHGGATRELNIIGQDTTLYGKDIYGKIKIEELLRKICALKDDIWVRLLYAHPAHVSDELIKVFKEEKNLCKYIDLPIQHINQRILKKMNRGTSKKDVLELIDKIRKRVPGVNIRTSVIIGFPGETEEEFGELLGFLKDIRFERLGAFIYSREEGTPAYDLPEQVSEKLKQERLHRVMSLQKQISEENNAKLLGKQIDVLIEEKDPGTDDIYIGRSRYDAPEVDGCVYVKAKSLKPGDIIKARVIDTLEYDLIADANPIVNISEPDSGKGA
jgi:ribosomal protein S12 methylthiotransferase